MKFDKDTYIIEMRSMVDKAIERMLVEKPDFEVYTISIWTDPNAGASAINFDSKAVSDRQVAKSNEWSKKYYDEYMAEGDLEQAKLFLPKTGRNCNPADFDLRNFEEITHSKIELNWEEDTNGKCWKMLEPALKDIGIYTLTQIQKLKLHEEFELAVNGKRDWYEFTWKIKK